MRPLHATVPLLAAGLVLTGSSLAPASTAPAPTTPGSVAATSQRLQLDVNRVVTKLEFPWDVQPLPDGALLVTERNRATLSIVRNGKTTSLGYPTELVWVSGETGLMSLAVDPDYQRNRRIFVCHGSTASGKREVRVMSWRLNATQTALTRPKVLLKGLPATTGRHGGCRLLIDRRNGALIVGTGDAAVGTNPRDLTSLGGKTLRLDRRTGKPWPGNPYIKAASKKERYVMTYGHRNVQGLAQRADGSLWSVEHGSYRDDEVNLLKDGGDYGWNPVPGYNESVPMTDQALPGKQIAAKWRSGDPTIATSGAAWVHGKQWGGYNGTLAVAALAGRRLVFLKFTKAGKLKWAKTPPEMRSYGRLRSVTSLANGDLLVTTSNGGEQDAVLRVRPGG